jgi:Replication-relaxation
MAYVKLETRDLEILRALLRVRYLTSRQLNAAFFSCPRVGRRRMHHLSEHDLMRPHTKGLSPELRYSAWRLTARGLDAVAHAFPDEPVPDGLLERVANGSLHNAQHHEALADLYLGVTVPNHANLRERDIGAHRRWATEMRTRAGSITWQPDGDVILRVPSLDGRNIIPDAVARSAARQRRVFIELDRSTKDLGRIKDGLLRYQMAFRHCDLEGEAPCILFVVRSAARKANILQLARSAFLEDLPLVVLVSVEAIEWLREELLSESPQAEPAAREDKLPRIARRAYIWMANLRKLMRANGMQATLVSERPDFMKEGEAGLVALYHSLKELEGAGARP